MTGVDVVGKEEFPNSKRDHRAPVRTACHRPRSKRMISMTINLVLTGEKYDMILLTK